MKNLLAASTFAFLLTACSANCLQKVAATEASITRAYSLAGKLNADGTVSDKDTLKALKVIDGANALADNAAPLCRIDDPKASDFVNQAGLLLIDASKLLGEPI